eukprot:2003695-Rhodomonas_salina.1
MSLRARRQRRGTRRCASTAKCSGVRPSRSGLFSAAAEHNGSSTSRICLRTPESEREEGESVRRWSVLAGSKEEKAKTEENTKTDRGR